MVLRRAGAAVFPINGKQVHAGQTIDLRVKYDVVVNGYTVISAGAPAKAIISSAEKNKMLGKGGELQLMPQYVQTVDGQFLPVTGMAATWSMPMPATVTVCVSGLSRAPLQAGQGRVDMNSWMRER